MSDCLRNRNNQRRKALAARAVALVVGVLAVSLIYVLNPKFSGEQSVSALVGGVVLYVLVVSSAGYLFVWAPRIDQERAAHQLADEIEEAFWRFDARRKGYSEWRGMPQSERDAFKAEMLRMFVRAGDGAK